MPANYQTIFADFNFGFNQDTFYQAVTCFEATQNFNAAWFYPQQDLGVHQAILRMTQTEMIPLEFDLGPDIYLQTVTTVQLGDPNYCSVFGAEWEWRELGNPNVIGTGPTLTVTPTSTRTYILSRTFPQAKKEIDYLNASGSCAYSDTITIHPWTKTSITEGLSMHSSLNFPGFFSLEGAISGQSGFGLYGEGIQFIRDEFQLEVFDLQGRSVYQTRDLHDRWKGDTSYGPVTEGLYVWTCRYRDHNNNYRVGKGKVMVMQ